MNKFQYFHKKKEKNELCSYAILQKPVYTNKKMRNVRTFRQTSTLKMSKTKHSTFFILKNNDGEALSPKVHLKSKKEKIIPYE